MTNHAIIWHYPLAGRRALTMTIFSWTIFNYTQPNAQMGDKNKQMYTPEQVPSQMIVITNKLLYSMPTNTSRHDNYDFLVTTIVSRESFSWLVLL